MAYYVLNTNIRNSEEDDRCMLQEQKAAAFFPDYKEQIERFQKGDIVFLYRSRAGIVAVGTASGVVVKRRYQNNDEYPDEEYCQFLSHFKHVDPPLTALEMRNITERNYAFVSFLFPVDEDAGQKLYAHIVGGG